MSYRHLQAIKTVLAILNCLILIVIASLKIIVVFSLLVAKFIFIFNFFLTGESGSKTSLLFSFLALLFSTLLNLFEELYDEFTLLGLQDT